MCLEKGLIVARREEELSSKQRRREAEDRALFEAVRAWRDTERQSQEKQSLTG